MAKKNYIECTDTAELCEFFGLDADQAKVIVIKTTAISKLDKYRQKQKMNNTEFSEFLDIPKSRWSSIVSHPEKVTVDYLINLIVRCGMDVSLKVA